MMRSGSKRTQEIDAIASDWLIRRECGDWSAVDQAGLNEWLEASTLHRVAFLRLELAWEETARLKALGAGIAGDRPPPPGHWNLTPFFDSNPSRSSCDAAVQPCTDRVMSRSVRGRRLLLGAAATVLLALGAGAYLRWVPHGERYATAVGGLASVPMGDGSHVTLNTDSQIRIALSETERRVELEHGEAFFEVSKDPRRPFVVRIGDKRVIAVGTKFSVRRQGDDVEIVVTEGRVRVEEGAAGRSSAADGAAAVLLTPGSIARVGPGGVLMQQRTLPEAEEQLSWRTGWLMLRAQSLEDAIAEFNRYNVRKIVIQDPSLADLKIEGNFRSTNVEAFVRLLESGFPVRAQVEPDQIVLTAK